MTHRARAARPAPFVTGSTMRHVVVMTLTGALGLMSLFSVDLVDLFFLSMLNQTEVTAAIGYAGTIVFTNLSVSIGSGIAAAALVARNLGAGDMERARAVRHECADLLAHRRSASSRSPSTSARARSCRCSAPRRGEAPGAALHLDHDAGLHPDLRRHLLLLHPARPRRCEARHVHHALRGPRHRLRGPDLHLRVRLGHPGRGDGHRAWATSCPSASGFTASSRSTASSTRAVRGPQARLSGALGHRLAGHPHAARHTLRQCLHDHESPPSATRRWRPSPSSAASCRWPSASSSRCRAPSAPSSGRTSAPAP